MLHERAAAQLDIELDETIRLRVDALSPLAETIVRNPRGTLVPTSDAPPHSGTAALETLRKIRRDAAALEIHETLGQGGMGIVRGGYQVTLDRRVAVKTLAPEQVNEENVKNLLGEAWLAGALEHPNVVPIYDLGLDERGSPLLVMKRIEGDTWWDLQSHPEKLRKHLSSGDPLEFNLRVLAQVCNAIHFAHSRNVIHRDLKPENVMIGDFGEVYVLDWGVAMRQGPVRQVAGTLVYMAPEMLGGMGDVTARTDVYLLGAVLYELVTGRPPHDGAAVPAIVASIVKSSPEIPRDVPVELASMIRACMSREPSDRPDSALAVRRAIELFLEHRGASLLALQAEQRLADLEAILASEHVEIERAYNVFGECRFGFRQALRAWPDAEIARAGLRRAVGAMVRHEAQRGDARAAALLFSELDGGDPELEALVAEAQRRKDEETRKIEELRQLDKDNDPWRGRQTRWAAGGLVGAMWTLLPLVAVPVVRAYPAYEWMTSLPFSAVTLVIIAVLARRWRRASRINRQLLATFAFAIGMQSLVIVALRASANVQGSAVISVMMIYWTLVMGILTLLVERRMFPMPVAYAAAFFVAWRFPEHRYAAAAGANFVAAVTTLSIWSHRATERALRRQKNDRREP